MASTLKLNTLTGASTAGSISVTGEGNSTTTNLQQGLAKQWAFYNQTTPAVGDSFNTTSITDASTGLQTINFTNSMNSTNFATSGVSVDIGSANLATSGRVTFATGNYQLNSLNLANNSRVDPDDASFIAFGDLA
tara:strand:+ start:241 stop:645 length:405 start_codon:yes stop_codon:yes gene_type:complete